MTGKRIFGIIVLLIGVGMMLGSMYVKSRVAEGREEIRSAQKKVDTGKGVFSLSPYTKGIGEGIAGSAQKKIDAGSEEAARYEKIAGWLQIGGIAFIALGAVMIFIGKRK